MRRVIARRALLVATVVELACSHGGPAPGTTESNARAESTHSMNLVVRPVRSGGAEVTSVDVRETIAASSEVGTSAFGLRAPITYASVRGIADSIRKLEVRDAAGAVSLRQRDDPVDPSGFPFYRHWRAERAVTYPVTVTYEVPPRIRGVAGPQFELRTYAGGISTARSGVLVLPEDSVTSYTSRLHWDLADLASGSIAVTTFGEGDFELRGSPSQLMQGYYMAGPLGRYPASGTVDGFSAVWLGEPPFDPAREMEWTVRDYAYLRMFFRDTMTSTFRVFMRVLPDGTSFPGTALQNSFMLGTPPKGDSTRAAPRETLTHEMVHHWALGIQGAQGTATWFHEGLAVFYARLLLMRAGLGPVSAYGQSINATLRGSFSNPLHNLSADAIGRLGFSLGVGGGSAQNVPYTRGSLYFADVDAQIRAASGGKRKLDDILLPLFARIRRGERVDQNGWVDALSKELGPAARAELDSVIVQGKTIVPTSNAFGPCFERRATVYTAQGKTVDGFEWVRVAGVPDERCREW